MERDWIMLENEAGGDRGMSPVDRNWLYIKEKEMVKKKIKGSKDPFLTLVLLDSLFFSMYYRYLYTPLL
jgi:hypothetical protein